MSLIYLGTCRSMYQCAKLFLMSLRLSVMSNKFFMFSDFQKGNPFSGGVWNMKNLRYLRRRVFDEIECEI